MTRLQQLFAEQGQSAWLDNLKRDHLRSGELGRLIAAGIRGVTTNPTIFEHAIAGSEDYHQQFTSLTRRHVAVEDAYWDLVIDDIVHALHLLRPLHERSRGGDGFASVELPPSLANNTAGSIVTARSLHQQINEPNLLVKIPATAAGLPAIRQMIAEGRNVNVTLIFSLDRYEQVIQAYLAGLQACPGDLSGGPLGGLILPQPGRHRGRSPPGRAWHRPGTGPAGPGGRRPGQARLSALPRPLQRTALGPPR